MKSLTLSATLRRLRTTAKGGDPAGRAERKRTPAKPGKLNSRAAQTIPTALTKMWLDALPADHPDKGKKPHSGRRRRPEARNRV